MGGKMVKQSRFFFLVVLMLFFAGCVPMFPVSRQSKIYEEDIKKIEVGSTTKAEVYDLLGKPNFLENDRYCVYEVCGWLGGIGIMDGALDFGGQIYRILLEFNENDRLINYKMEKGIITGRGHYYHYLHPKIAISPNGKTLAVICPYKNVLLMDYKVLLIDLETKEKVELETKEKIDFLKKYYSFTTPGFSPDSRKLLLIADYVKVIDVSNHSKAFLFKGHGEYSHWALNPKRVTCLAFFPDGKKVATGGSRGFIKIWELSTGTEIMTFKAHNGVVDSIKISPDGRIIAAGLDDSIRIWDSTTGNEIMTFKTHEKRVDSIEISPDGKIIATGSGVTIRIWDSTTGNELYQMISETDVFNMVNRIKKQGLFKFSPDGKLFAVNRGTHIELWSINQERDDVGIDAKGVFKGLADVFLLPVFDESSLNFGHPSLDFSNDGKIVAASYGSTVIYNLQNRQRLWSYNNKCIAPVPIPSNPDLSSVKRAALHPNGRLLSIYTEKVGTDPNFDDLGISFVNLK
jgi:WD40 repeat protein